MENNFTIPQSALIKDIVCSLWQVHRHNEPSLRETIIPKGLIEIIFSFETSKLQVLFNNQIQTIPRCFIQGFHTSPVQLNIPDTHTFFGIILNAASIKHIFHFHPAEFSNQLLDLTLVDASFYSLWHQLGEQNSLKERVNIFTNWLLQRLPMLTEREKAFDVFLKTHTHTNLSVTDIAGQFCYSTKQLTRKLYELTGMNTEQTLLYKKYLQAVHLIHTSKLSLTEIAYSCHFSDQSHFIKTFKGLSRLTPNNYRQRKGSLEGHIFEIVP
ncbi:MAG: helix-turn-helix transcriptional regulator [Bacteroidetes bacterium]|nr:helix-turn-helix transcriptional regulator [Bacteroidota bacterium]MBS1633543.1 helix-turn-helix transcriptional regulator [Bacteroidota bacterium]